METLTKDEPFVILLDLDQTIQGDIGPQLQEYQLIKFLNDEVGKKGKKLAQNRQDVIDDMQDGLLRPHFKRFIVRMKKRFPTCEFFIYTASQDTWGKYIASIIQDTIEYNFNKRVFTRSDCVYDNTKKVYMKSIDKVTPYIYSALKKKYNLSGNKNTFRFKNIILIDNSNVLYPNELRHLVKCDDYKGKVYIDCLRNLPKMIVRKHFKQIGEYLSQTSVTTEIELYQQYYTELHVLNQHQKELNKNINLKDKFWKIVLKNLKHRFSY